VMRSMYALLVTVPLFSSNALAQPSSTDPRAAFAVRPGAGGNALAAQAETLDGDLRSTLDGIQEKADRDALKMVAHTQVASVYANAVKLERLAEALEDLGETAGFDFRQRATQHLQQINLIVSQYKKIPGVQAQIGRSLPETINRRMALEKQLPRIGQMAQRNDWAGAEEGLYGIFDTLQPMAVWYSGDRRDDIFEPFLEAKKIVDQNAQAMRRARAEKALASMREANLPNLAAYEIGGVQVVASGGSGPRDVAILCQAWSKFADAHVKCQAIDRARQTLDEQLTVPTDPPPLVEQAKELDQRIAQKIAQLVRSDAERGNAADARALYVDYLRALSMTPPGSAQDAVAAQVKPELAKLVAKSPKLAAEVANYRRATSERLRWRERAAAARVRARAARYPEISTIPKRLGEDATVRHLLPASVARQETARLTKSAPETISLLASSPHGFVPRNFRTGPFRTNFVEVRSQIDQRIRVHADLPTSAEAWRKQWRALRADLLCDDTHPPLTLEATFALGPANQAADSYPGHGDSMGGTVTYFELRSYVNAVINDDRLLVSGGVLPWESDKLHPARQVLVHCSMDAKWLRHRYFFVDLAAAP
jgi:hypothetical protein